MTHEEEVICDGCEGTGRNVTDAKMSDLYQYIKTRKSEILPVCKECEGSGTKSVVLWSSEDAA